jgi:hypothetical protein
VQQILLRDGCFLPNIANQDPADLAREASASSSSEARLSRVDLDRRSYTEGLGVWKDQIQHTDEDRLTARRGQWIAVGADRIDTLSVCLSNTSDQVQSVNAWLVPVDHIWDYRIDSGVPLASTTLQVPPGVLHWIDWPLGIQVTPGCYVRLDLGANSSVKWHASRAIEPGHLSAYEIGRGKMRRYGSGLTMSFRISPAQPCYGPRNVLTGVTRPHRFTNLWRSDPAAVLPQWLQLDWLEMQTIQTVELTFPGHLIREYHSYSPFYRDAQCVRDYTVQAWIEDAWVSVVAVRGNYQRHRRHPLEQPITTQKLRILVEATNGDPSAAIYEVRCYGM